MYKISCCFFVIDDMITQEKIQKLYIYLFILFIYFFFLGGGGGEGDKIILKLAVNSRTKFRNTHWLEKSITTVEDKPWKLFCKTSLNAREQRFRMC